MLVHAVTGIDDGNVEMPCHQVRGASRRVANDDAVRPHGAQGVAGIEQGFAFLDARSGGLHQRGHSAQRFRGEFEGRAGTGGRFVKQKHDALAAQQWTSLQRIHAAGQREQAQDFLRVEVFDSEQRTACGNIHRKNCKRCIIRGRCGRRKMSAYSIRIDRAGRVWLRPARRRDLPARWRRERRKPDQLTSGSRAHPGISGARIQPAPAGHWFAWRLAGF